MFNAVRRRLSSSSNLENIKLERKVSECLNLTAPIIRMGNDQVESELRKMEGKLLRLKKCQKTTSLVENSLRDFNLNLYNSVKFALSNLSSSPHTHTTYTNNSSLDGSPHSHSALDSAVTNGDERPHSHNKDNGSSNMYNILNDNSSLSNEEGALFITREQLENGYLGRLNEIFFYVLNIKSKLFRPYLSLLTYHLLNSNDLHSSTNFDNNKKEGEKVLNNCKEEGDQLVNNRKADFEGRLRTLLNSYELVHIGSLIHDDFIDDSRLRRNKTCPHLVFGPKNSVLIGDYLLAKSSALIVKLENVRIMAKLSQTLQDLIHGELFRVNLDERMYSNYFQKIYLKTASLIANNISSIPILLGKKELEQLFYLIGVHVGLCFQICDDVLDYSSSVSSLGKPILNDLKSGTLTLPLIYSVYNNESVLNTLLSHNLINNNNNNNNNSNNNNDGEERRHVVEELVSLINRDRDANYYKKCKLCILYHLNEVVALLEGHGFRGFDTLVQYVYEIVNRK